MIIFRRILLELFCILFVYAVGLYILALVPFMDLMLSPGGAGSVITLALAGLFLLFRGFVLVCLPGWILARGYLLYYPVKADPPPAETPSLDHPSS